MCHIPTKEFKKVEGKNLVVYKVAVETHECPFALNSNPFLGFKVTDNSSYWIGQQFILERKYHTIFTGDEIRLGTLMHDYATYAYYSDGEDIGPGYYHFFETKRDAEKFLQIVAERWDFRKTSRPCILVGEIPVGEMYNEGTFYFEDVSFCSIVAKTVYYTGELYYEGE